MLKIDIFFCISFQMDLFATVSHMVENKMSLNGLYLTTSYLLCATHNIINKNTITLEPPTHLEF